MSARFSLQIPRRKATRAGERGIRAACARLPLEEPTGVHAHPRVGARPRLPPLLAGAGRRFPFFKSLPVLTLWVAISLSPYFKLSFFAVGSWARSPQISLPREQVVKAGARLPHVAALPLRRPPQGPLRASPCTRDFLESGLSPSPQIPFLFSLEPQPPEGPHPKVTFSLTLCCHATRWDWRGARSVPGTLGPDRAPLPAPRLCATCMQAGRGKNADPSGSQPRGVAFTYDPVTRLYPSGNEFTPTVNSSPAVKESLPPRALLPSTAASWGGWGRLLIQSRGTGPLASSWVGSHPEFPPGPKYPKVSLRN